MKCKYESEQSLSVTVCDSSFMVSIVNSIVKDVARTRQHVIIIFHLIYVCPLIQYLTCLFFGTVLHYCISVIQGMMNGGG
jgi:hypothetical protein